ncbi:MAG TPA: SUF system Fe-S cluster assembly protein [Gammaproteobacteria bacterium]|nr:SUF system Fe-S cluster assembly protein [Gammaproteobacteria bacterium]
MSEVTNQQAPAAAQQPHTESASFDDEPTEKTLQARLIAGLQRIYDPEIPVNIYDLGLIYDVAVDENQQVHIQMTLTAPGCPVAQTFPGMVENEINKIDGVSGTTVEIVWDPPWTQDRISEAARLELGLL